jgi:hypothetical protein
MDSDPIFAFFVAIKGCMLVQHSLGQLPRQHSLQVRQAGKHGLGWLRATAGAAAQ